MRSDRRFSGLANFGLWFGVGHNSLQKVHLSATKLGPDGCGRFEFTEGVLSRSIPPRSRFLCSLSCGCSDDRHISGEGVSGQIETESETDGKRELAGTQHAAVRSPVPLVSMAQRRRGVQPDHPGAVALRPPTTAARSWRPFNASLGVVSVIYLAGNVRTVVLRNSPHRLAWGRCEGSSVPAHTVISHTGFLNRCARLGFVHTPRTPAPKEPGESRRASAVRGYRCTF